MTSAPTAMQKRSMEGTTTPASGLRRQSARAKDGTMFSGAIYRSRMRLGRLRHSNSAGQQKHHTSSSTHRSPICFRDDLEDPSTSYGLHDRGYRSLRSSVNSIKQVSVILSLPFMVVCCRPAHQVSACLVSDERDFVLNAALPCLGAETVHFIGRTVSLLNRAG